MSREKMYAALSDAVANVFSLMPEGPLPETGADGNAASVANLFTASVRVESEGREFSLHMSASAALCHKVLAKLFPGETSAPSAEQDTLGELLNLVVESTRTLLRQQGLPVEVGVPAPVPTPVSPPEDVDVLELSQLGEPLQLWLVELAR